MNVTMTREEMIKMLDINNDKMRYLTKKNKLSYELELLGYKIINKNKIGRNTIYELQTIEVDEWRQYQSDLNIRKKDEHTKYVESRLTKEGLKSTRKRIVENLTKNNYTISETTARKFDIILLEDEVMEKDKTVYLLFNTKEEEFLEITEQEYKQFWADLGELGEQFSINKKRYLRREISEKTYDSNKTILMNALGKEKGVVALRYETYKEYLNTVKVLEMIKKHRARRMR